MCLSRAELLQKKDVSDMRARILEKAEGADIVLEADNKKEEKQLERIWASRESIALASLCRIGEPSTPGIFLSLRTKNRP